MDETWCTNEFVEERAVRDATAYFKHIRADKSERIAEKAFSDEHRHVTYGASICSVDIRYAMTGFQRRMYKAVFGRTFRDLLWDIAGDRILDKELRMEKMEYDAGF